MAQKKTTKRAAAKREKAQPLAREATAPKPGTTLTKTFKGKTITVKVTDDGFVCRGKTWKSLTALALHVTGYKAVSGPSFFGLAGPKGAKR